MCMWPRTEREHDHNTTINSIFLYLQVQYCTTDYNILLLDYPTVKQPFSPTISLPTYSGDVAAMMRCHVEPSEFVRYRNGPVGTTARNVHQAGITIFCRVGVLNASQPHRRVVRNQLRKHEYVPSHR